eukprot:7962758-Pyramimonas_sp.AAC.1
MTETRTYHCRFAAHHAHGGGAWTILRRLLEEGEAIDKYFNVGRLSGEERIELIDKVRNQQCQWVPDISPIGTSSMTL